ncbi:MAG: DNA-binding protein [Tenericutes bacterium HGW-Tenericutes-6]|nr:MAG: DNA-binding protein [Tenericutes bacterium HGW-Tenericutes-6]
MMFKVGEVNRLKVNRKTDIGYMLESKDDQVFLHFNESKHESLKPQDEVDAFIYYDNKGRLTATLHTPHITQSRPGFLEVKDIHPNLGVFLDMGISKDLLLSYDDLPLDRDLWPIKGDKIYVLLKAKSKLVAKLPTKQEVILKPEKPLELMTDVEAYVLKIGKEGINLLTEEGHHIFVHQSMLKETPRLGQKVRVKVTFESEKGYSGSLIKQKENAIFDDANDILSYIIRHDGMPYTSDSDKDEIYRVFKLSKKAFKRALGHLYKERKIDFVDGKTILVKHNKVK